MTLVGRDTPRTTHLPDIRAPGRYPVTLCGEIGLYVPEPAETKPCWRCQRKAAKEQQ